MDDARAQLAAGDVPSQYVILRVAEQPDPPGNANRARSLRQLIETSGYVARAPEAGEYEALRAGIEVLAREQGETSA
jgi:hypothetical protein